MHTDTSPFAVTESQFTLNSIVRSTKKVPVFALNCISLDHNVNFAFRVGICFASLHSASET